MEGKQHFFSRWTRFHHRLLPEVVAALMLMIVSTSVGQENLPAIVKKVEPSTVVVRIYDRERNLLGHGTGFFVDKTGDVITNYHVLQEAGYADVKTSDGKVYPVGKVLADDREGDLVQISVETSGETSTPSHRHFFFAGGWGAGGGHRISAGA